MPGSQRFSLVGHCAVPFPSRFDPSIYVLRSSLIPLGEKFPVERLNHGFFDGSWVGQSPFLIFLRSQSLASAPSPGDELRNQLDRYYTIEHVNMLI